MKTVIIAGGKGTRIASSFSEIPKAMIPVEGKPVIQRQVEMAASYGFKDFIFLTGHLGDVIRDYFKDGSSLGVNITYCQEKEPLGTAGALRQARELLTEDFFVFYGDTVMDVDLEHMLRFHRENRSDATLFVHPNDHPYDSDIVETDSSHRITAFRLKPHEEGFISRNQVNASLFILSPKVVDKIPEAVRLNLEKDIFPSCLDKGMRFFGYPSAEYIKDMGTPERYAEVCADVRSGRVAALNRRNLRPAVFLDRDGVINVEKGFLSREEDMELIEGAAGGIARINASGWLAIVVTNQPVIARGDCSWEELGRINARMETLLGQEHAFVNDIYICPHHPDKGFPGERPEYKIVCDCRKPSPGMLLKAAGDWGIDLSRSIMIGDHDRDVMAGENAGVMASVKIPSNEPYALSKVLKEYL
ncbi:MAG: HAD-IIIA family hydrolase [Bacteroidales bacterium]|nr:HAD-IIIA family hydrolase [Bacteroidales bacterium]